ncbi:DUF4265 domain-containing protein (plasmid) [Streptomyces sp. NBC_01450]|uniref:DUF4265 domain-containing protein n=1 Tax=Streptomyces sp. NBC_01450 TaxID=2903871 RepID=UPI002E3283AB|nr:DUF4265 domain-containing protein [Streptomyces sp. NBC_01450]
MIDYGIMAGHRSRQGVHVMKFIVHDDPVGRSASNFIARADLASFGMGGQVEQLWLKAVANMTYEVACIPFFTYGLALGDTVLLTDDNYVNELVRASGHRALRMMFVLELPAEDRQQAADRIRAEISQAGLLSEWSGERYVAVDVPPNTEPSSLFAVMESAVNAGDAFWEWASARPFITPA